MISLLEQFSAIKVLNWDDQTKRIIILGQIEEKNAIAIIKKLPFTRDINYYKFNNGNQFFLNDIYTKYITQKNEDQEIELIFPASDKHIEKYKFSKFIIVNEKYEEYLKIDKTMRLDWLYNILDKKAEIESIFYENDKFMIIKDYNFDNENLHCIAVPLQKDITSLRDLRSHHLDLLKQIQIQAKEQFKKQFNKDSNQIRMYIHYPPTFYHFHIHITDISQPTEALRDHQLSIIIQNIEMNPNYYQQIQIEYKIKESQL